MASFMTCATADIIGDVINNFKLTCSGKCPELDDSGDPIINPNIDPNTINPCGCSMQVRAPTIGGIGGITIPINGIPCCESNMEKSLVPPLILPPVFLGGRAKGPNGGNFKNMLPIEITIDACNYHKIQ
ncbi:hypothetical protein FBU30_002185 [Linnemannia zychae]|nr:hypothetical protein FBU30_002185 [Linnemannia zychae]